MTAITDMRLNLLLFSVGGVRFGMDSELASGVTEYSGEQDGDLFWFHDELGYGCDTPVYRAPSVVTVRTADARPYRVIIDALEDVAEISAMDIRPFPVLLEAAALRKGLWGILLQNGSMVLLVDFKRAAQERRPL